MRYKILNIFAQYININRSTIFINDIIPDAPILIFYVLDKIFSEKCLYVSLMIIYFFFSLIFLLIFAFCLCLSSVPFKWRKQGAHSDSNQWLGGTSNSHSLTAKCLPHPYCNSYQCPFHNLVGIRGDDCFGYFLLNRGNEGVIIKWN